MHTPINSRSTPFLSLTLTPARTTDPHPAFPAQHLFLAADANAAADQAGHAGVQIGSHRKASGSPQLTAVSLQDPLPGSSSVCLRQREEATGIEREGTTSLFDHVDQAGQLGAMVTRSWGRREDSTAKMVSHESAESPGLDIDAFLPPSLSPRQARGTAVTPPSTPRELQKAVSGCTICVMHSCLLTVFVTHRDADLLCRAATLWSCSRHHIACVCRSVCVYGCVCIRT